MSMSRIEILDKLAKGELSADDATRMIREMSTADTAENAAPKTDGGQQPPHTESTPHGEAHDPAEASKNPTGAGKKKKPRFLKIRVGDAASGHDYVKVNIPLSVVNAGVLFGARLTNRISMQDWEDVLSAMERDELSTLVEVGDATDGERVRIYVE